MARQDANAAFAETSFLYGGNAAYIEQLYARYQRDPKTVDAAWAEFFQGLSDAPGSAIAEAKGPAWRRRDWPIAANGELVSALDGDWHAIERALGEKIERGVTARGGEISVEAVQQASRDSVHAIMMIRAYRMRGHLHANLDPLGLAQRVDEAELDPASYGFSEADYDRKIFIDHVLGLEFATVR
jgi:2-oxoglutarate dehydrogenase E1 component